MQINPRFLWWHFISFQPWPKQFAKQNLDFLRFQSHRGYHHEGLLENSKEAFQEAFRRGAQVCECDVQLSRDDIPVVFHDEFLQRIFNHPGRVRDLSVKELKKIGNIYTLEEILSDPNGPPFFNIELKTRRIAGPLASKVNEVIQTTHSRKRVLFSSFNPFVLKQIEILIPFAPRALLVTDLKNKENPWFLRKMIFAPFLKIHMLNLDQIMLTPEVLQFWKRKSMPLSVWTINDPSQISFYWKKGVQSIISDLDPALYI